jgi:hypothetical protein
MAAVGRWLRYGAVFVVATTVIFSVGVATGPAAATPTAPFGSAYVWADQPSAASYTPHLSYQFNSTGAVNTITRSSVGRYTVRLPGLGSSSGTVHVTAYGASTDQCKVARWGSGGGLDYAAQLVEVRCFDRTGAPSDSMYTMSYTNRVGAVHAYLWADQATATAEYEPFPAYSANYTGVSNTVWRYDVGRYVVRIPVDFEGAYGHAQATAYGEGSEHCAVVGGGWARDPRPNMNYNVICFTSAGQPADAQFTLTYVRDGNILGEPVRTGASGHPSLYLDVRLSTSDEGEAGSPWYPGWYVSGGGRIKVDRLATGRYAIHPPIDLSTGNVQVTTDSLWADLIQCKVLSWTPSDGIVVHCFDQNGAPTDGPSADHFEWINVSYVGAPG